MATSQDNLRGFKVLIVIIFLGIKYLLILMAYIDWSSGLYLLEKWKRNLYYGGYVSIKLLCVLEMFCEFEMY